MDELQKSVVELTDSVGALVSSLEIYKKSGKKAVLRTIRQATLNVARTGKNFRAVSMAYEKAQKQQPI